MPDQVAINLDRILNEMLNLTKAVVSVKNELAKTNAILERKADQAPSA